MRDIPIHYLHVYVKVNFKCVCMDCVLAGTRKTVYVFIKSRIHSTFTCMCALYNAHIMLYLQVECMGELYNASIIHTVYTYRFRQNVYGILYQASNIMVPSC
jgi:hypothetical protein